MTGNITYTDLLYEEKQRSRDDHHQPAGEAERVSRQDLR